MERKKKLRDIQVECVGKIPYPTRKVASQVISRMVKTHAAKSGDELDLYECRHCNRWHVGGVSPKYLAVARRMASKRATSRKKRGRSPRSYR